MNIRSVVAVAGLAGTLVITQLVGSALAASTPDPTTQGKKLLASYDQTNKQLATCMHGQGLAFDAGLAKSDVVDAFSVALEGNLDDAARAQISAQTQASPDDPNGVLTAKMTPPVYEAWAKAVNDCSAQLEYKMSGGAEGMAKIAELQRAAKASPEVQAAAQAYVKCMLGRGYTVNDPFAAPKAIMEAQESAYSAEVNAVLTGYDRAWRTCVAPYQQTYDNKLFGSN